MFDFLRIQAGASIADIGTSGMEAVRAIEWDWTAPPPKRVLAESSEGSAPVGTDAEYEDRQITITLDGSSGSVPGDPTTGLVSNLLSVNGRVAKTSFRGASPGDTGTTYVVDTSASNIPARVDAGIQVWASEATSITLSVKRGTTVVGQRTISVAARRWTHATVFDVSTAGTGTLSLSADSGIVGVYGGIRTRMPVIGRGTAGVYFDGFTPGATQPTATNYLFDPTFYDYGGWVNDYSAGFNPVNAGNAAMPDNAAQTGYRLNYTNTSAVSRVAGVATPSGRAIPVTGSQTYYFRAEAYAVAAPAGTALRVGVNFYDASGASVGYVSSDTSMTAGQRSYGSVAATAPAGAVTARPGIYALQGTAVTVDIYVTRAMFSDVQTGGYYDALSPGWTGSGGPMGPATGPHGPATRPAAGPAWSQALTQGLQALSAAVGLSDTAVATRSSYTQALRFNVNALRAEVDEDHEWDMGAPLAKLTLTARPFALGEPVALTARSVRNGVVSTTATRPVPGDVPAPVEVSGKISDIGNIPDTEALVIAGPHEVIPASQLTTYSGTPWNTQTPSPAIGNANAVVRSGTIPYGAWENVLYIPLSTTSSATALSIRVAGYGASSTPISLDPSYGYIEWGLAVDGKIIQTLRTTLTGGLDRNLRSPWRLLRFAPAQMRGSVTLKCRLIDPNSTFVGSGAFTGFVDYVIAAPVESTTSTLLRTEGYVWDIYGSTFRDDFRSGSSGTLNGRSGEGSVAGTWSATNMSVAPAAGSTPGKATGTASPASATFTAAPAINGARANWRISWPSYVNGSSATFTLAATGGATPPALTVNLQRNGPTITGYVTIRSHVSTTVGVDQRSSFSWGTQGVVNLDVEIQCEGSGHWQVNVSEVGRAPRTWQGHAYSLAGYNVSGYWTANAQLSTFLNLYEMPVIVRVRGGQTGKVDLARTTTGTERPLTSAVQIGPRPSLPPGQAPRVSLLASDTDTEAPYALPTAKTLSATYTPRYLHLPEPAPWPAAEYRTLNFVRNPKLSVSGNFWTPNNSSGVTVVNQNRAPIPDGTGRFGYRLNFTNPTAGNRQLNVLATSPSSEWMPMVPGRTYYIGMEVYVAGSAPSVNAYMRGGPSFVQSDGSTSAGNASTTNVALTAGANYLVQSFVAPANAAYARPHFGVGTSNAETLDAYVTNMWLSPQSLGGYYDGDSPRWRWTGINGESYSEGPGY